jgi:translation initiation factor IF-2
VLASLAGSVFLKKDLADDDALFRVWRGPEGSLRVVEDGLKGLSLRRFKDEAKSVKEGDECGLSLVGFTEFEQGDEIECYVKAMVRPDTI